MKLRIGDFKIQLHSDEYKPINLISYSARRLIGSRIIESAAYCHRILLVPLYLNSTQKRRWVDVVTFMLGHNDPIKWRIL